MLAYVRDFLTRVQLTSFNVGFDGAFLQAWTGQWLDWVGCSYALFKQLSTEGFTGQSWDLETAQMEVLGWPESGKAARDAALVEYGLSKANMAQLPPEILGPYCATDAEAHWQLWDVLTKRCEEFPALLDYHKRLFMTEVRLLVEQQFRGIQVDQTALQQCRDGLTVGINREMANFLQHPEVEPHVRAYNDRVLEAYRATEPPKTTAKGEPSKRWEAWRDREAKVLQDRGFNPNSPQQLEALFYDQMGYKSGKRTDGGRRSVDRKILPTLGEPGKILVDYNLLRKRLGYANAVAAKSARDGLVHPQFNTVGTVTTRLGGSGGLNMQQMPKVADFLHCLAAREGYILVDADAEALEPTVLAEFSQDKALMSLYGPSAKQNDVYLYLAAKIPALGKEVRKYYDPDNPTKEGIAAAKKYCKRDRAIAKVVHLSSVYGAQPPKIYETLILSGIDISFREVVAIHAEYWRLFAGVKRFEQQLLDIWTRNGGWIPSLLGTPICVDSHPLILKDINNRFCQTSGHLFLQLWLYYTDQLRRERGMTDVMHPWLIDNHDQQTWEVKLGHEDAAQQVITDALKLANDELGMGIAIKSTPETARTFGKLKAEGYEEWLAELEDAA